ncbi:hypothetical protein F7725_002639 [Dissostichus mawsoni]|uniref:Titin n=1 Tax=Dissostichus mawsoni TaxID=36200 RepID=A0A7J5Y356_DISMA|nr:hypothetical protein F7725_002639 [Dissostichus mawsoni]
MSNVLRFTCTHMYRHQLMFRGNIKIYRYITFLMLPSPPVLREIVADTELNVEGLIEGMTYIFRVNIADLRVPPGPPTCRVANTTDHSIDVEWDPPADNGGGEIMGYQVDKAMVGSKDWSRSTERLWKSRAFTVFGVREGAKYQVRVIACNTAGEGTPGFTEAVFVRNPAEKPVIEMELAIKAGVFIRAGENLRLPATVTGKPYPSIEWTIEDSKPDKDRVEILTEGNDSIVSIKNIQRKDSGKYHISVCNPSGIKNASTRVEVMDVPGPVTDLKPVVVTRKMIFLNWDDPDDDGGSDLIGFIVERRDIKMHTWRQPVETASSKCECVGIMEGQEYMFRVIAKNKFGLGPPVELGPIKAVDPQGPPSYPEKFHYTERTKNSVTFTWKPPRNDGGSPVIGYFIEKKRQDEPAFVLHNKDICPSMTMTVEGLEEDWPYEFRIKCANLMGESEPSIPLNVHMLKHFKGDSIIVKKGEPIEIPADIIGLPIPTIEWTKDDVLIAESTEAQVIETEVTGRLNARTKLSIPSANRRDRGCFTVTASNNMGSAHHTISVMVLDRPVPPRNLTVSNIRAESCYLHWDAPLDNGGSELTNYIVEKRDVMTDQPELEEGQEAPPEPQWVEVNSSVIDRKFGVWNLETNKSYLFRVKAQNRYGISDPCTTEEVMINDPFGLPGPPEKPTIAEYSKTTMTLSWEPPRDTGGSMIVGYWLEKREKGSEYWAKVNKMPVTKRGMKGWEYQVVRLIEGTEYEFRVAASNSAGTGPFSAPSDSAFAVDPITPPSMPAAPEVVDKTKHSVTLAWTPPEKDGGSPVKGYIIEIQDEGSSGWQRVNDVDSLIPTTEFTMPSLRELKRYYFRVIAVNDIGESDPSPRTTEVLVQDVQLIPAINIDMMVDDLLYVRAGDAFKIPATIKGRPTPKVTWEFTGKAKSHKKNKLHTLPVDSEVRPPKASSPHSQTQSPIQATPVICGRVLWVSA